MSAAKLRPFTRKHGASPTAAMSRPASAGPTMRAPFMITLLRVTALVSRAGPTISNTKVWRVGMSKALTVPTASANPNTAAREAVPVATSRPRPNASAPESAWVMNSSRRLSTRSATTPPRGPTTSMGRNWHAMTRPSQAPLPVSCSTSQPRATVCIQVPLTETSWPAK